MIERCLFVGLGGAGGNIVNQIAGTSSEKNHKEIVENCLAFNVAKTDLNSLRFLLPENKIKYGTIDGCARSRELSKSQLYETDQKTGTKRPTQWLNTIMETLSTHITKKRKITEKINGKEIQLEVPGIDLVFVFFSAGGGTGSGSGPIITNLLRESFSIPIIPVVLLPEQVDEIHLSNAIEVVRALTVIKPGPVMLIDNSKYYKKNIVQDKIKVNEEIINLLTYILEFDRESPLSQNIDTTTKISAFTDPGCLLVGSFDSEQKVDKKKLLDEFRASIINNPFTVDLETSPDKEIIIFELEDQLYDDRIVDDIFKSYKTPRTMIQGLYNPEPNSKRNKISYIFTGMGYPQSWIEYAQSMIENAVIKKRITTKEDIKRNDDVYTDYRVSVGADRSKKSITEEEIDAVIDRSASLVDDL